MFPIGRLGTRLTRCTRPASRIQWHPIQRPCLPRFFSQTAVVPPVTKIEKIVLDGIKATGPLSFATYMQLCLSFPGDGYYMKDTNAVFGARGDFTTSPEISQVFGELVGVWLVSQWLNAGRPESIRLVELGPGRGTLMADILRMIAQFAPKGTLKGVHLVETSPAMQALQENALRQASTREGWDMAWHDSLHDIKPSTDQYTMLVAHEFFDALPIHIIQKKEQGWHEVMVANTSVAPPDAEGAPPAETAQPDAQPFPRLQKVLSPTPSATASLLGNSSPQFKTLPADSQVEISPTAFRVARMIGDILTIQDSAEQPSSLGGCALIVDYGGDAASSDSFRAFKDHKMVDTFHRPGECDLTADVDFSYLREALQDLVCSTETLTQGEFLLSMGLKERVRKLVKSAEDAERKVLIERGASRLINSEGMGSQYKVMGIVSKNEGQNVWPFKSLFGTAAA